MAAKQSIGVIGSGQVAQVLAAGFAGKGHAVMIGTREPAKLAAFGAEKGVAVGSFSDTAAFGKILILAVKGSVALDAVAACGAENITGKVFLDACNPLADAPPENGILRMFTGPNESLMERLQAAHPTVRFVKCFSCVGNGLMIDPKLPGGPPTMFICGNDAAAKEDTVSLLAEVGWGYTDVGLVTGARAIEPLVMLWCSAGFLRNDWMHAFADLKM